MPTYQYLCTECGEPLEAQQSFSEPSLTECPACNGRLRKVFNAVGVVFKGSGFYRNDSRGADPSEKSASTASTSPDKSDSTKSTTPESTKSSDSTSSTKKSDSPAGTAKATTPA